MSGIHHVTAISGKAARNLHFYTHVIGLRFRQEDGELRQSQHLSSLLGDQVGHPGTILTFFPWEHAASGRAGWPDAKDSVSYFREINRVLDAPTIEQGVAHEALERCFDEPVLSFNDPARH